MWFDGAYMPEDSDFVAAFSKHEHEIITAFNASLERLSLEAGNPPPVLENLFSLPSWAEVELRANAVWEKIIA